MLQKSSHNRSFNQAKKSFTILQTNKIVGGEIQKVLKYVKVREKLSIFTLNLLLIFCSAEKFQCFSRKIEQRPELVRFCDVTRLKMLFSA